MFEVMRVEAEARVALRLRGPFGGLHQALAMAAPLRAGGDGDIVEQQRILLRDQHQDRLDPLRPVQHLDEAPVDGRGMVVAHRPRLGADHGDPGAIGGLDQRLDRAEVAGAGHAQGRIGHVRSRF
jgi:hypothetical protein